MNNDSQTISNKLIALDAFLVVSIIVMVFAIYGQMNKPAQKLLADVEQALSPNAFDSISLQGKSAYVFDVTANKVLFKKNEFLQLPLASITKLMTALVATDLYSKDAHVIIKREFLAGEGDSGLFVDETWRMKDLLDFSLVSSSNDGAISIASTVGAFDLKTDDYVLGRKNFVSRMNDKAKVLGLKETYFINESGLDENGSSGGYGSAIDVAKLMQYILENKPEIVEATKYQSISIKSFNKTHTAKNTDMVINEIPNLIASKTGYTDMAGGNLVVAFDASIGRPIIVVVLGSSEQGRFSDVSKLVNASLKYISE
ncbi:MAG TPA: hypothetical protein VJC13_03705 [Candidatus Paceibacterota bacterium]